MINKVRGSDVWPVLAPLAVGAAYACWRYHRFSFENSLILIVLVAVVKWALDRITQNHRQDQSLITLSWIADVILPYLLLVAQLVMNTNFALSLGFLLTWFGVAWPLILLSVAVRLAKNVRVVRAEELSDPTGAIKASSRWIRPLFLTLPFLAYGEILLYTLSGYMPVLSWAMIVLFPLVLAQALAVGLESDLDRLADLPARNLFLTAGAMVLVLVISSL